MQVQIITNLSVEPVTVSEAKSYLRIIGSDEDTLIGELITSARERLEKFTGLSFGTKTLKCYTRASDKWFELPYQPLVSITSVLDDDGTALTYETRGLQYKQILTSSDNGINITYVVGWGNAGLPKGLKQAILKQVSTDYENRENYLVGDSANELSSSAKMTAQSYSRNTLLGIL